MNVCDTIQYSTDLRTYRKIVNINSLKIPRCHLDKYYLYEEIQFYIFRFFLLLVPISCDTHTHTQTDTRDTIAFIYTYVRKNKRKMSRNGQIQNV